MTKECECDLEDVSGPDPGVSDAYTALRLDNRASLDSNEAAAKTLIREKYGIDPAEYDDIKQLRATDSG